MASLILLISLLHAAILLEPKEVQVQILDESVNYHYMQATLKLNCFYSSGVVWRETKSCNPENAKDSVTLKVTEDGKVLIPKISTFGGVGRAGNINNYEISITVVYNDRTLFHVFADGKKEIRSFAKNDVRISVLPISPVVLDPYVNFEKLAGSALAQRDLANLHSFISIKNPNLLDERYTVYSSNYNVSYENRDSGYERITMRDFKRLAIPELFIAYEGEFPKTNLYVTFKDLIGLNVYPQYNEFVFKYELEARSDTLQNLSRVDLERRRDQ